VSADALFDLECDWSRAHLTIREAPVSGRDWNTKWHYSTFPPSASVFYGAFGPDLLAVVAVGTPAGNISGVAGRYALSNWPGNLEITRVICHPDAPKNTASRCIAAVLRHVHAARRVDWVFSYADTGQGHHGGIYQALNAVYVGLNGKTCHGYQLNGVMAHPKPDAITPKHTYILPCSEPSVNRAIRHQLKPYARPYPKRLAAAKEAP
jgi:hypothetical protein